MNHWTVAPIVLPAMLAAFTVLVVRFHPVLQRVFSIAGAALFLAIALGLFLATRDGTILLYQLGHWAAPFGIVLVVDRLAAIMVLLTGVLALLVLIHAVGTDWDRRGNHFHALFQFQIMGIAGAFLTGDIFNLFVFFEVLLIASYGLMIHGGGSGRLRAGTQYVAYNLLGSTLFLFALGTLYAETGTLNMADLVERVRTIDPAESAGIRMAAVLLLMVFAVKAAIAPLQFWLPASYSEAPAPVAALFAIMTKVGAYAIIRIYTLVFPPDLALTEGLHGAWLLPAAIIGLMVGMLGTLAARRLDRLAAFAVIGSMGMVMVSVAIFTEAGIAAALYYIVNSTLATAALFLVVDLVRAVRGSRGLQLEAGPPMASGPLISALFFASAIAMTGLPPLSGFVGKLLILDAAFSSPMAIWAWAAILVGSLISVVGFSRAGSTMFWKTEQVDQPGEDDPHTQVDDPYTVTTREGPRPSWTPLGAVTALLMLIIALTVFAGPIMSHMDATAAQLFDPQDYIRTVLQTPGKEIGGH